MNTTRRHLLQASASLAAAGAAPWSFAAEASRRFDPQPGAWRTFEVTTRVDLEQGDGPTQLWLPIPSVNTGWQLSLSSTYASSGEARIAGDSAEGARMVHVEFAPGANRWAEVTSRVQTRNRATTWDKSTPVAESPDTLAYYLRPTTLIPTDGIVRKTALKAIGNATADHQKAERIYQWVVANAWREPEVRGCGEGDIKTMLETGNLGGKCADLNALFVGLCRSVGVPARDVYGLRLAPSAFGYKELGGNPLNLKGAQHCRAEVYLKAHGWTAMDPADVAKVMRQETPQWIRDLNHPLITPVRQGLFGGWEGNWVAWNTAHDVKLPGSKKGPLGFLMYPTGEDKEGRFDSYTPDLFKYTIRAREV
ncbi:transglutaminase-like domain-containing protein [Ramlibacter albus]|uniref:Transglutaminase domain-containing protein n=1 Tax=Ramlibacter albus TaxID=2079448 RepID=A0A923MBP6_9BURK|nr:transglutaminase domain-containing protein [Ramlibacter albus]MBC5766438.1 transglutaminase domain-containing protein [Ramlibacter albus]